MGRRHRISQRLFRNLGPNRRGRFISHRRPIYPRHASHASTASAQCRPRLRFRRSSSSCDDPQGQRSSGSQIMSRQRRSKNEASLGCVLSGPSRPREAKRRPNLNSRGHARPQGVEPRAATTDRRYFTSSIADLRCRRSRGPLALRISDPPVIVAFGREQGRLASIDRNNRAVISGYSPGYWCLPIVLLLGADNRVGAIGGRDRPKEQV